jgi:hypothetical protein
MHGNQVFISETAELSTGDSLPEGGIDREWLDRDVGTEAKVGGC